MSKIKHPLRILFSSTRGWNPGDQFILMGIRRLLDTLDIDYTPILYNRHPAVRTISPTVDNIVRGITFLFANNPDIQLKEWLNGRYSETAFDNSFNGNDKDIVDAVVFAGSPEWAGKRNKQLFQYILKHRIPIFLIGVGSFNIIGKIEDAVLREYTRLIVVRDDEAYRILENYGAHKLPCPALFSAPEPRRRETLNRLGIVFGGSRLWANSIALELMHRLIPIYKILLERYNAEIICHHFSELCEAQEIFGPDTVIRHSYDAYDYPSIYDRYDVIVGTRIHGSGMAASLGIPNLLIRNDRRSATAAGFHAEFVSPSDEIIYRIENIDIVSRSNELIEHRQKVQASYIELLGEAFSSI